MKCGAEQIRPNTIRLGPGMLTAPGLHTGTSLLSADIDLITYEHLNMMIIPQWTAIGAMNDMKGHLVD